MIYPTDEQLLAGIATALKDTVLPELERGSAARKQLQAAIETLRRMAFAAPGRDAALAADNADMAEVVRQVEKILGRKALSLDGRGLGEGEGDGAATHQTLQQTLIDLQINIPPDLTAQITPLLTQLYARMTDRALALIPPPMPRSPRKPA
jgi:hypothetical protein